MKIRPLGYRYVFAYARNAVFFAVPALLVMSFFLLSPIISNGTHATDDANNTNTANEDPSISIIPTGDLIIPINNCTGIGDGSNNTTVCTGTMDTSISITTSVTGGYSLYMNTSTTDNTLSALGPSTSTISSITNPHSSLSSFPNNTWGYSKDNGATYLPIPTSTATAEQRQIATTASAGTSTHNIDFAAKTDLSNTAGRYENTIIFSAVTNPTIFYLNYDANGGTGAPAQATCTSFESTCSFTVSDTIPTKDGYNFLGWATSSSATIPEYAAGDTYTATTPTNNTLHAVWEVAARYMQDVDTWGGSIALGRSVQAVDQRDNKLYWVTRLADGELWMTQNLDFNINADTVQYLNSTYTDVASWSPSAIYYTKTTLSANGSTNDPYSWDMGDYYYNPSVNTSWNACGSSSKGFENCASYGFATTKPSVDAKGKTLTEDEAEHYQVGTLYNWQAATAGTGNAVSSGIATGSICPAGWELPYSGDNDTNKGFGYLLSQPEYNLISSYNKFTMTADPLYFVPGGYKDGTTLTNAGNFGRYWASRASSSTMAYNLYFTSSSINPSTSNGSRNYARYVRCVAKTSVKYMQEVAAWGSELEVGDSAFAIDKRDGASYTVARLEDGELWMTSNLKLQDYTLTSKDSDVTNDFILPASSDSWTATYTAAMVDYKDNYALDGNGDGAYYNYYAASAGTVTNTQTDATASICPKGWTLPTGGANGQFNTLAAAYNFSAASLRSSPALFTLSGYHYDNGATVESRGSYGYWWSASASSTTNQYGLYLHITEVYAEEGNSNKRDGLSVRCIAKEATYMQDVDEWGDSLQEGDSRQVTDKRDGKEYWVTRLADGNIWMTQNLDFNINARTAPYLNSTYTDVELWEPDAIHYTKTEITATGTTNDYYTWDFGDYYYNPSVNTSWNSCSASSKGFQNCANYGFTTSKPTSDAGGRSLSATEAEHYQVGTLYQWQAATAGTGGAISSGEAVGSICPKGWRLPYSGDNTTSKGFGYLLSQPEYNLISSYNKFVMTSDPLYFVPGGYVEGSVLTGAGNYSRYWSSRASSSSDAYHLYFTASSINPSYANGTKSYARYVRCVVK